MTRGEAIFGGLMSLVVFVVGLMGLTRAPDVLLLTAAVVVIVVGVEGLAVSAARLFGRP